MSRLWRRVLCAFRGHRPGDSLFRRERIPRELSQNPGTRPLQGYEVVGHVCGRCERRVLA